MKTDNNIDRYFRENLYDFQMAPPQTVWDRVEQDISKKTQKLIIPIFLKVAAGILLLATLATLLWKVTDKKDISPVTTVAEEMTPAKEISSPGNLTTDTEEIVTEHQSQQESIPGAAPNNQIAVTQAYGIYSAEIDNSISSDTKEETQPVVNSSVPDEPTHENLIPSNDQTPVIAESLNSGENEPANTISKNDVILQQNLMVLEQLSKNSVRESGSRWSVGGQAGPQYSYRDVSVNPGYPGYQDYDQFEDGMLAFAGGINVQLQAAKRFSIQSGVYYSKIGQEVSSMIYGEDNFFRGPDANYAVASDESPEPINNSTGTFAFSKNLPPQMDQTVEESTVTEGTVYTEQSFEFVEFPLIFKYFIVDRKLDISLNGGIWTNILIGNKAIATDNLNFYVEDKTNDINTFNYSGSLGIGFNYPLTSNLLISLDPIFKYYLSPINSNPETEVHPYTFGIMTGINFSF